MQKKILVAVGRTFFYLSLRCLSTLQKAFHSVGGRLFHTHRPLQLFHHAFDLFGRSIRRQLLHARANRLGRLLQPFLRLLLVRASFPEPDIGKINFRTPDIVTITSALGRLIVIDVPLRQSFS